jgi:hypothetical protein
MDCRGFQEYLAEYVLNDPRLTTADRQEMQPHMGTCSECCQVYAETQWVIALIRDNKERSRGLICCGKDEELQNVPEEPAGEKEAESLAAVESALDSPQTMQAAWRRLTARFEAMDKEGRRAVRAKRVVLARRSAAIAASLMVACGLGLLAIRMFSLRGPAMVASETSIRNIPSGQEIRTANVVEELK